MRLNSSGYKKLSLGVNRKVMQAKRVGSGFSEAV